MLCKIDPADRFYKMLTLFCNGTGMDVLHAHVFPYLSLMQCSNVSRINKFTYSRMHQREEALYIMRQIWNIVHLSRHDKIITICKAGVFRAFVCAWYMEHKKADEQCEDLHYMEHAVVKGEPRIIRFLTNKLSYENGGALFFINTVTNLMKNGHLALSFDVYANKDSWWWQQYEYFDENDKFTCWKETVKCGHFVLEEKMAALFVQDTDSDRKKITSVRLLVSVASLKAEVFEYYFAKMSLFERDELRELLEQAGSTLMIDTLRSHGKDYDLTRKQIAMGRLVGEKLKQLQNAPNPPNA